MVEERVVDVEHQELLAGPGRVPYDQLKERGIEDFVSRLNRNMERVT
jgi:hypothetical protein